jgi:WD40 repeat protein
MPPAKPDSPIPTIWQEKGTARAREVDALAFAPDGKTLVCSQGFRGSGRAYGINILDATTLKELHSFKHEPCAAQFVGFGPDGTALLLRGVGNKEVKNELEFKEAELIELATGKRRAVVDHGYWTDARLSPDGKTLVAARQGHVSLFDATTGKTLDRFLAPAAAITDRLAFSDGNTLVVLGVQSPYFVKLSPCDLTVYDLATRKTLGSYNSADADARKYAQAFRLGAPTGSANKWAIEYLDALRPHGGEELSPYTSALTRDGKTLALNWRPQHHLPAEQQLPARVQIIDLDSGKEIASIPAPGGATAVAFSSDGKRLVVGASGVILWESADANFVTIDGSDGTVKPGDFGYRIGTATADGRGPVRISLNEEAVRSFGGAQLLSPGTAKRH